MCLLLLQRVHGGGSLERAVYDLPDLPSSYWPDPCKRVRDWRENGKPLSSHTGAYNQARQCLPESVVQRSFDRIFEQLIANLSDLNHAGQRAFLLDGTTVRTAHSKELSRKYPPGTNQHGEAHWPLLRMLVAHDLDTGLAMRPEWGPVHGANAVSEQALLKAAMGRLPKGAIAMGDANFGVFSVAYAAHQSGHPVLLRLSSSRARRLAGEELRDGIDRPVQWKASPDDRKNNRELPAGAELHGRVIVHRVHREGKEPFLLALFTTLQMEAAGLVNFFQKRWNIETDLRTLKATLHLDQLTSTKDAMVAKEIIMGMAAYNLVRGMICLASGESGVPPRQYGFTKVRYIVEKFGPRLANASSEDEAQRILRLMKHYIDQARRPPRKRKQSSYPREAWPRGAKFPTRKTGGAAS